MTESGSRVSLPPHPVGVLIPLSRDRHRSGGPGESPPGLPQNPCRSSCPPNRFLGHETDGGGIAKVVMPLAAHPFNMVVGHFVD